MLGRVYDVAIYLYGADVHDVLGGVRSIREMAPLGLPKLTNTDEQANTYAAFMHVEKILKQLIGKYDRSPAPLLCHITGGEYPGPSWELEECANRIKSIRVADGNVLVENILIDDEAVLMPSADIKQWAGIHAESDLAKSYARQLMRMSSVLPESYRKVMMEYGYHLTLGARMLFPATQTEMIGLGLAMSAATPVRYSPAEDDRT